MKFLLLFSFCLLLTSCASTSNSDHYFQNTPIIIEEIKSSSILFLPVKFFQVNGDINKKFTISKNDFNLSLTATVLEEFNRIGLKKSFVFNDQKEEELTYFSDISDLSFIAGQSGYNDISNIISLTSIAKREGINFIIFPRTITIDFVANEQTQGINRVQDGKAVIYTELIMFDIDKNKIVKLVKTYDEVSVLENPAKMIYQSIKNKIYGLFI